MTPTQGRGFYIWLIKESSIRTNSFFVKLKSWKQPKSPNLENLIAWIFIVGCYIAIFKEPQFEMTQNCYYSAGRDMPEWSQGCVCGSKPGGFCLFYLAVLGCSCGTRNLWSLLRHARSSFTDQGSNWAHWISKLKVLALGPPGSPTPGVLKKYFQTQSQMKLIGWWCTWVPEAVRWRGMS